MISTEYDNMKRIFSERAKIFDSYFERYLPEKEPKNLYRAVRQIPMSGGKRMRPCIAMLVSEAISGEHERVMPFASSIEIMHSFTLVHDDIMDNSDLRRGSTTVHKDYGEPTAILAGDCLFSIAFKSLLDLDIPYDSCHDIQRRFVDCVIDICEGQEEDMNFETRDMVSEEEYLDMIAKKTAVLFALGSSGAGIIHAATDEQVQSLYSYGFNLGLAFQIWDDYLDFNSTEDALGKDIGNDIRNGKKTLIAVRALRNATGEDKTLLNRYFGKIDATDEDIKTVHRIFADTGSIDYAGDLALSFNEKAKEHMKIFPASEAREALLALADYAIRRKC